MHLPRQLADSSSIHTEIEWPLPAMAYSEDRYFLTYLVNFVHQPIGSDEELA